MELSIECETCRVKITGYRGFPTVHDDEENIKYNKTAIKNNKERHELWEKVGGAEGRIIRKDMLNKTITITETERRGFIRKKESRLTVEKRWYKVRLKDKKNWKEICFLGNTVDDYIKNYIRYAFDREKHLEDFIKCFKQDYEDFVVDRAVLKDMELMKIKPEKYWDCPFCRERNDIITEVD